MELVPPTAWVVGSPDTPVVCGKQGWCGRGLAAVRWSDIASKLAHLERFASSKGPCGVPIAHGVQWLATAGEAFRGVAELLGSAGG